MSGPVVRRMRLPPDATSPAAARGTVASTLADAGLGALREEALLLTSELVSNGVIHAGTEIELEIVADRDGVQVAVTDFAPPPPTSAPVVSHVLVREVLVPELVVPALSEGGRGLLLVSRVASRWGTSHEPGGRTVWFHLDAAGATPAGQALRRTVDLRRGLDLATVVAQVTARDPEPVRHPGQALEALVVRLGRALGAATATVSVDRGDGLGPQTLARYASPAPATGGGRTIAVPLELAKPWSGTLTATGALGPPAQAVAALVAGQLTLLVEAQRQADQDHDRGGWLLFLAEAGQLLAQSMNVPLTVALIPRLVVPRLGLWCAVQMVDEYGDLTLSAVTHADEAELPVLTAQLGNELAALQAVVDGYLPLGPPTDAMAFPLTVRGERLGVLTVGRPEGRAHHPEELAVLADLGRRAAGSIDNARVHDQRERIATALQRALLPPELPSIDGLEVAAQYVPAGDGLDVGGDFYDLMPLSDGWMLAVGDVSGKGVGAAAVTGMVREVLHTLVVDHRDPEPTLSRLNAALVERGGGYFCTLALAFLRPSPDDKGFDVAILLAGHDQPVLLRADGSTSLVGQCGTALGLLTETIATRVGIRLAPGDALVFYTDGVTERRKGRQLYGQRRLRSQISALAGSPAATLASQLCSSVLAFSPAPPRDDIAIVALRAL